MSLLNFAVNGGWSGWGRWSGCGKCIGGRLSGTQYRGRNCNNPTPKNGGRRCSGGNRQSRNCNIHRCVINGGWSGWGRWSGCSRKCNGGTQDRRRYCNNPAPKYGGRRCPGGNSQWRRCNTKPCGGWSGWGGWSGCSAQCNGGIQFRQRNCRKGVLPCPGKNKQQRQCNTQKCPSSPTPGGCEARSNQWHCCHPKSRCGIGGGDCDYNKD